MTLSIDNHNSNDLPNQNDVTELSARKQVIASHFSRANQYNQHAQIQQRICQQLCDEIANSQHKSVLEVGAGRGQLTRLLAQHLSSEQWVINELSGQHADTLQAILPRANILIGDAETLPLTCNDVKHSLIISANAIQWFDNPLGFIEQSYQRLAPSGQLLFNTFTPDNFYQIKTLTGQGLTYPTTKEWQQALQHFNFTDVTMHTQRFDVPFASPYAVLKHMKLTGVSTNQAQCASLTPTSSCENSAKPFIWTKSKLKTFENLYWEKFSTFDAAGQRCVILTYSVLIISAFKR